MSTAAALGRRRWMIGLAVLVLLVGAGLWWRAAGTSKARPAGPAPIPVATVAVVRGDIDVYLDALGTVTPVYTVSVASRVAGELTEVHYREGQSVRKNDLLAVIDPRPYRAAVVQAQGQLERDRAALRNARIDLTRYENSFKDHAIPQQQVATQQALVEQDEGTVTVDQGNLDAAQVNLDYTRIVSPIDGRVGLRTVDPGNIVPANGTTGLVTVTQLQPITVIFVVAEDAIGEVVGEMNTGRPLPVIALDRTKQKTLSTGTLLTIDNQVNTTTGTVRARATFANEHHELFPNQFVNARLLVKTLRQVNLVPQAAIQHNNDLAFVYVVQPDSTVQSRTVTILATEGETSAVTGVDAGDQLVSDGFDKLQNGSKIVRRQAAPAKAGTTPPASGATPPTTG